MTILVVKYYSFPNFYLEMSFGVQISTTDGRVTQKNKFYIENLSNETNKKILPDYFINKLKTCSISVDFLFILQLNKSLTFALTSYFHL